MFIIGIDPHRGSHAAVVIDRSETVLAVLELPADRRQRQRLLGWSAEFTPRVWAIEGATGTGALLAQQLIAAGERVIDVPPKLAARVRLLDNEQSDKSDRHDARSVAIVALRKRNLHDVTVEDHAAVLRLLAKRHHDLVAGRTRVVCRLHTTLCFLAEGKFPQRLRAEQAAAILARIHPTNTIGTERKALARDLLAELRRHDRDLDELAPRIRQAVTESATTVTQVHGVGPIMAAYIIGHTRDIARLGRSDGSHRDGGVCPEPRDHRGHPGPRVWHHRTRGRVRATSHPLALANLRLTQNCQSRGHGLGRRLVPHRGHEGVQVGNVLEHRATWVGIHQCLGNDQRAVADPAGRVRDDRGGRARRRTSRSRRG